MIPTLNLVLGSSWKYILVWISSKSTPWTDSIVKITENRTTHATITRSILFRRCSIRDDLERLLAPHFMIRVSILVNITAQSAYFVFIILIPLSSMLSMLNLRVSTVSKGPDCSTVQSFCGWSWLSSSDYAASDLENDLDRLSFSTRALVLLFSSTFPTNSVIDADGGVVTTFPCIA